MTPAEDENCSEIKVVEDGNLLNPKGTPEYGNWTVVKELTPAEDYTDMKEVSRAEDGKWTEVQKAFFIDGESWTETNKLVYVEGNEIRTV